ncbi:hypothetical protein EDD11_004051 [Mortierella claussenii]|nr:hypothetical protein EDD11_004051 [Mortierella claussenii]
MKFLPSIALLTLTTLVSAQNTLNACTTCLQSSISALPLCKGLNITIGDFQPGNNPTAVAACLCSSLSGNWIDQCTGAAQCGQDIASFKNTYSGNIQAAGLSCGTTPSFVPVAFV